MTGPAPGRHAATTVLLTGGAGFIGSNFVRLALGNDVRTARIVLLR